MVLGPITPKGPDYCSRCGLGAFAAVTGMCKQPKDCPMSAKEPPMTQQDANETWQKLYDSHVGHFIASRSKGIVCDGPEWAIDAILADHDAAQKLEIAGKALARLLKRHYPATLFGHDEGCAWHGGDDICNCGGDQAREALALINQDSGDNQTAH